MSITDRDKIIAIFGKSYRFHFGAHFVTSNLKSELLRDEATKKTDNLYFNVISPIPKVDDHIMLGTDADYILIGR